LLPVVIVWLRLLGQAGGLFGSTEFGAATVAVAMMISMSAALLWCAALLDRLDRSGQRRGQQILKLNAALDDRLRALEVANKELEGFSYATSHVLQTPLRAIDGFSQVLLDDYSAKLDDEGRRLLGIVRTNARQMGGLIDEILGFLRLGRDEMHVRTVDMRLAVQAALKELEPQTRGRKIDIQVPALPTAYGDPTMIHRVWVNLLDHAVKFSATRAEPSIQVGAVTGNNEDVYYVRDNGVGFDEQFRAKLFGVFNRLHGEEFTGNGMGLAIVQRVMMRHGGRVWAEGKLGEGATFYFSLPRKVRDHG
jgi:light-regulated signal transduction histidine kinase (bacteriophytochrome)